MLRTALGPAIARFLEDPPVVAAPAFAISKLTADKLAGVLVALASLSAVSASTPVASR